MTVQQLKEKIAANSAAWHKTEDAAQREALHQANMELYSQLDAQTGSTSNFDSASGKWSTTAPGEGELQLKGPPKVEDLSSQVVQRQEAAAQKTQTALGRAKAAASAALEREEAALPGVYTAAKTGQTMLYTLDGSDPRFSATAQELTAAGVTGVKGQTIKVAAKDPSTGFTSNGVAEHVFSK